MMEMSSNGMIDEDNESVTLEAPERQKVSWANDDSLSTFHLMSVKDLKIENGGDEGGAPPSLYNDSYSCIETPEGEGDDDSHDESTIVYEGADGEDITVADTHVTEEDEESTVAQHTLLNDEASTIADDNTFADQNTFVERRKNQPIEPPAETPDATENDATAGPGAVRQEENIPDDDEDDDDFSIHVRDDLTLVSGITGIWGSDSTMFDSSFSDTASISKNGIVQSLYSDDDDDDNVHTQQEHSHHPGKATEDVTEDETSSTNHSDEFLVRVVQPNGRTSKLASTGVPTKAAAALEQKRRERAARMARVKERIRMQNTLKEVNEEVCQQLESKTEREAKHQAYLSQRRALAFRWYIRLGRPSKASFRRRTEKMIQTDVYCELSLDDIETLSWSSDGRRVDSTSSQLF